MTSAIPWTAPVAPPPSGLLNTPGPVLAAWLLWGIATVALLLLMPGRARQTMTELWRPWGAWLARLHVAVAGLGVWIALFVLAAPVWLENISLGLWRWGREQLRRLAYSGYDGPILT